MTVVHSTTALTVAEVWVPTQSQHWELVEASYATGVDLRPATPIRQETTGILADVVRRQNAVCLADCSAELALRGTDNADLDGMIAIPCFLSDSIAAVLVLAISCKGGKAGLEVWAGRSESYELCLADAVHPGLTRFAAMSKYVHMPHGSGLPGRAWASGLPQIMRNIGRSRRFLRSSGAESQGLHTGFALPLINGHMLHGVATLLSSAECPLARAYEIWTPDGEGAGPRMRCRAAHHGDCQAMPAATERLRMQPGQGLVGTVWSSRRPMIIDGIADSIFLRKEAAAADGIDRAIAFPIFNEDDVSAIALMLL